MIIEGGRVLASEHERFMEMALEEARIGKAEGNSAIGSVIVKDGKIIAQGHNTATADLDITAHAETVALRNAGPALGHMDLSGCSLYTTMEPCMMCAGAIVVAGISTLVMGGNYSPMRGSYGEYSVDKAFQLVQRGGVRVVRGVMVQECEEIGS